MYSMVLVASLATAGDVPEFGKKSSGGAGCTGAVAAAPAGCTGVVVAAPAGCTGGGRQGLFARHKDKGNGCTGGVSAGCSGVVVVESAGCSGGGRQGLFSRLCSKKDKGSGCSGMAVPAAPCGCCGTPAAVAMPAGDAPKPMEKKVEAKTGKE